MRPLFSTSLFLLTLGVVALSFPGCSDERAERTRPVASAETEGPLVIYSGRKDVLVGPLVERFQEETGIDAEVRYGTDAELIAALQEEGASSPADILWANTAGALGAAAKAGLFVPLSDSLLGRPAAFTPSGGRWVPASVRFRVLAYHPERVAADKLPASVLDLPQLENVQGRIGWTPLYSSFQDFVTAMRLVHGERSTRTWLGAMQRLEPKAYESNTPMLEALAAGEIDVALTNHYYVLRMLHSSRGEGEGQENPPVAIHHFESGDAGNLALVTGAGLLRTAAHPQAAERFLQFLLAEPAQRFAATEIFEYPVIEGVALPDYFLGFGEAVALSPTIDTDQIGDMQATLDLLRQQELL